MTRPAKDDDAAVPGCDPIWARVTILGYNDDDTVDIGVHNLKDAKRLTLPSVDASPGGVNEPSPVVGCRDGMSAESCLLG